MTFILHWDGLGRRVFFHFGPAERNTFQRFLFINSLHFVHQDKERECDANRVWHRRLLCQEVSGRVKRERAPSFNSRAVTSAGEICNCTPGFSLDMTQFYFEFVRQLDSEKVTGAAIY